MKHLSLSVLFFLVALVQLCFSASAFTKSDEQAIAEFVQSALKQDISVESAGHGASVFSKLGSSLQDEDKAKICKVCSSALSGASTEDLYHCGLAQKHLSCGLVLSEGNLETLQSSVESGNVEQWYQATHAIVFFDAVDKFDASDLVSVVNKISELQEGDGTFSGGEGADEMPLYHTGLVLKVLSLAQQKFDIGAEEEDLISTMLDEVENVMELIEEQEGQMVFVDSEGTASILMVTVNLLSSILELRPNAISKEQVAGFANFILDQKQPSSVLNADYFLQGLHLLSTNSVGQPLVFRLTTDRLLATAKGKKGHVVVEVTDVLGNFACDAQVFLVKAVKVGGASSIPSQQLSPAGKEGENKEYYFNMVATKPTPGTYDLTFSVSPVSTSSKFISTSDVVTHVKIVSDVSLSELKLSLVDKDQVVSSHHYSVQPGQKLSEEIQTDYLQQLSVSFTVKTTGGKAIGIQQAFIRVGSDTHEAIIPARFDGTSFSLTKNIVDLGSSLHFRSGVYSLSLIIGDSFIENSHVWLFAKCHIKFQDAPAPREPWQTLPEIPHTFRPAEYRPHDLVSVIFVGLCVAPLGIFLIGLLFVKANLNAFPSGLSGIHALCFQACICLMLALFVVFWIKLSFFETIKYVVVLAIPTVLFGKGALDARASNM